MASSAAAKYQARWRPVGSEQWSRPRDFPVRAEIEVDGLDRNTEYEFEVRAVSACGASSVWVPQGYTVPDPPALPPPTVPTTKPGPDGIDLDWGDGEDGVRGDLTYEIQRAKILGAYASAAALVSAHPTGTAGDAYFVGSAVYGWDGAGWVDVDEVDNAAWTTVAKTKGTTWTDVVLDTDQYTYRIRSIDYNGNVSGWVVIGQSEAATISTVEFADQTNQQIIDLLAADADMAQDIIDANLEIAQLTVDQAVLRAQIGDILEADEWVATTEYPKGDLVQYEGKLYRSLIDDNLNHEPAGVTDAYWEVLGNYASLGEAVGAVAAQVTVNTADIEQNGDDITAVSETVNQHSARMPSGTGQLATQASVTSVESASVSRDNALSSRVSTVEARMPSGSGELATAAGLSALDGRVTSAEGTITAHGAALTQVQARIGDTADNLIRKSIFEDLSPGYWTQGGVAPIAFVSNHPTLTRALGATSTAYPDTPTNDSILCQPGDEFDMACDMRVSNMTAGSSSWTMYWFDAAGTFITTSVAGTRNAGGGGFVTVGGRVTAPAGAMSGRPAIYMSGDAAGTVYVTNLKCYRVSPADAANAAATQALDVRVTSAEGQISTTASDVSSLTATVNGQSATITQLAQVSASMNGVVTIADPDFELRDGWTLQTGTEYASGVGNTGTYALRFRQTTSSNYVRNVQTASVQPGQKIKFTFYTRTAGTVNSSGTARFGVTEYDSAGGIVTGNNFLWSLSLASHGWTKRTATYTVPSGVTSIRVFCACAVGTGASGYLLFDSIVAETISTTDAAFMASYSLTLDVNGYVTGFRSENTGSSSTFDIVADKFRIVSPGGGARTEYSGGNWRIYDSSGTLRVRMGVW